MYPRIFGLPCAQSLVRHTKKPVPFASSRLFHRPPGNSHFAGLLPDSEVVQRVEIAESPVKRAFRGVCPHPVLPYPTANSQAYTVELR